MDGHKLWLDSVSPVNSIHNSISDNMFPSLGTLTMFCVHQISDVVFADENWMSIRRYKSFFLKADSQPPTRLLPFSTRIGVWRFCLAHCGVGVYKELSYRCFLRILKKSTKGMNVSSLFAMHPLQKFPDSRGDSGAPISWSRTAKGVTTLLCACQCIGNKKQCQAMNH